MEAPIPAKSLFHQLLDGGHLDIMVVPEMADLRLFRLCMDVFFEKMDFGAF
jgi:hypothetical protein